MLFVRWEDIELVARYGKLLLEFEYDGGIFVNHPTVLGFFPSGKGLFGIPILLDHFYHCMHRYWFLQSREETYTPFVGYFKPYMVQGDITPLLWEWGTIEKRGVRFVANMLRIEAVFVKFNERLYPCLVQKYPKGRDNGFALLGYNPKFLLYLLKLFSTPELFYFLQTQGKWILTLKSTGEVLEARQIAEFADFKIRKLLLKRLKQFQNGVHTNFVTFITQPFFSLSSF